LGGGRGGRVEGRLDPQLKKKKGGVAPLRGWGKGILGENKREKRRGGKKEKVGCPKPGQESPYKPRLRGTGAGGRGDEVAHGKQ